MPKDPYENVAKPLPMRGRTLRNRVYISAHQPGLADDGLPGDRYIEYHRQRAKSGMGMQLTGANPVIFSEVWASGICLLNVDDRIIPGYRKLAKAVHDEGGLMLAQLAHVGAMETHGDNILSASWEHSELTHQSAREATVDELADIVGLYKAAASRCREGELDGVEVSMAHGMLLHSFLSPLMNRRRDRYGGTREARTLFPKEVLLAVRQAIGSDRILGIRIPGHELVLNGIQAEEAAAIAAELVSTREVDYVSVTAGNNTRKMARVDHWPPTPAPFGAFRHLSRVVKAAVDVPVATVGRVTSIDMAEEILSSGDADLVGMARAAIADPEILSKSKAGRKAEVRPCVGANVCINGLLEHKPLSCMVNPDVGRPRDLRGEAPLGLENAMVVGAGPAGLEIARRLAIRGVRTTLFDRASDIGGQMRWWSQTPSRREFQKIIEWWRGELMRLGVEARLGVDVSTDMILDRNPSLAVIATGSTPIAPEIALSSNSIKHHDVYDVPAAGDHILVVDQMGKLPGMLTAERLSQHWRKVTLVTNLLNPGEGEGITTQYTMIRSLAQRGVEIIDRARVVEFEGNTANLQGVFSEARPNVRDISAVVWLKGALCNDSLYTQLQHTAVQVIRIGDAKRPRDVSLAVRDAAAAIWDLQRD
jgi:2,4-dienoyl-CoA reductase-like NADH-dependent reductase (Old Yellow Enzyme family)